MTNSSDIFILNNEQSSITFAEKMAALLIQFKAFDSGCVIYLNGDLGAGKSFFARALIQYFLPLQKVKSPTYNLIESYPLTKKKGQKTIHHLDLYRLCDPEELEFLALKELFVTDFLALIEWPQNGQPDLIKADLSIEFAHLDLGRKVTLKAFSNKGEQLLQLLKS